MPSRKPIIYRPRSATLCVRIPNFLKANLEEYTKKFRITQADVIICLLNDLNMIKDITKNDK